MSSRYSLTAESKNLEQRFGITMPSDYMPRYNIAVAQSIPVIANDQPDKAVVSKWGLVPHWGINDASGANLVNIKEEMLLAKNTFKALVNRQRCIVPADGYYEWKRELKQRIPFRFVLPDHSLFAFAGIWDEWKYEDGTTMRTFGIITAEASEELKEVSDRMPVVLSQEAEKIWLHAQLSDNDIRDILAKHTLRDFHSYKSHRVINSPTIDAPECILPAPEIYPGETYKLF